MCTNRLMLYFPAMHPGLVPASLPASIKWMDPGYNQQDDEAQKQYFRPADLVYEGRLARTFLEDTLHFGSQFKRPGDAAWFQAGQMENFFSGSMQDIKGEILATNKDGSDKDDADVSSKEKQRRDAQLLLLLGCYLEEQGLEFAALQEKIHTAVRDFEDNLGMDKEDQHGFGVHFPGAKEAAKHPGAQGVEWQRLVNPFLRFVPEQTALVITDACIFSALKEGGLEPTPARDRLARLFPSWEAPEHLVCTVDSMTAEKLGSYAGVRIQDDIAQKEILVVGLVES